VIGRLKTWAALIGLVVTALGASWFGGRKSARTDTKIRRLEDDLATASRAKEIENEVEAMRPDALRERARRWVRPPQ
jgi:hypothetical protein